MTSSHDVPLTGTPMLASLMLVSVEFRITPGFPGKGLEDPKKVALAMDFATQCHRQANGNRAVLVEVTVRSDDPAVPAPYTGKIVAMAMLSSLSGESPEAIDEIAMNYGAPVAFSLIRDEYLRLTGMTDRNRLVLPLVQRQSLLSGTTYRDVDGTVLRQMAPGGPVAAGGIEQRNG